jgi:hypothetical protein
MGKKRCVNRRNVKFDFQTVSSTVPYLCSIKKCPHYLSAIVLTMTGILFALTFFVLNPADLLLAIEDAVQIALENNYDIRIGQAESRPS